MPNRPIVTADGLFPGPGELASLARGLDWSATPLGAVDQWESSLRTTAALVVATPAPMLLLWGPAQTQIYNDAYVLLMGARHPQALGLPTRECWPEGWSANAPIYARVVSGESVVVDEALHHVRRGDAIHEAWFTFAYAPVQDDDGAVGGIMVSARESTAEVLSKRAAAAASRVKADFLAVMSHELRTPLNAIGGYAELLGLGVRGPITPEQRDDLVRIQRSQRQLMDVIDGVLDYAKVDAGLLHYAVEDVPMDELLARCKALVAAPVREKGITLRHDECSTHLTARADGDKVQRIVLNLLSNAIKFTAAGGVVTLACVAEHDKRLVVHVSDTGQGIAASDLECVFQPFVQVDSTSTRAQEGTGLGLAIARDLARGMGGDLTVHSTLGQGSEFTLTLACGRGEPHADENQRRSGERA